MGCAFAISRDLYFRLWGCDPDMRVWGSEDADLGLKAWLMGGAVLCDPQLQVGHRFRAATDSSPVLTDLLANRLRMARKNFTEPVWADWLAKFRARVGDDAFDLAWACFEERRESVERERDYLLSHRPWDEFDFAEHFRLKWPRRA
jgi:hypothetical protein